MWPRKQWRPLRASHVVSAALPRWPCGGDCWRVRVVQPPNIPLSNPPWRSAHPRESGVCTVTPGTGGLGQCLPRQERGPQGARQGGGGWSAHTLCRGSLWLQELPPDLSGRKEGGLLVQGKDMSVPGSWDEPRGRTGSPGLLLCRAATWRPPARSSQAGAGAALWTVTRWLPLVPPALHSSLDAAMSLVRSWPQGRGWRDLGAALSPTTLAGPHLSTPCHRQTDTRHILDDWQGTAAGTHLGSRSLRQTWPPAPRLWNGQGESAAWASRGAPRLAALLRD